MKSKLITCSYRYAAPAIAHLFVICCLLTCGCGRQITSAQQKSSNEDPQKKMIEHVIAAKLPESVKNCRYHSKDYGMGRGIGWGYFEISRLDLQRLLNASDHLPYASELGQDSGARFNVEKYIERTGESIAWWKPLLLRKRQYGQKVIGGENVTGGLGILFLPQMDICVGEIRDNWMGVYLVYNCD